MKAIAQVGSEQIVVIPGTKVQVRRLDKEVGQPLEIDKVLWVSGEGDGPAKTGKPTVAGAKVVCKVLRHLRGEKIIVFKKRSKKAWKKQRGHRDDLTELFVEAVKV